MRRGCGVQAGAPFQLSLRTQNRTDQLLELALRLRDVNGFVLEGTGGSLQPNTVHNIMLFRPVWHEQSSP